MVSAPELSEEPEWQLKFTYICDLFSDLYPDERIVLGLMQMQPVWYLMHNLPNY